MYESIRADVNLSICVSTNVRSSYYFTHLLVMRILFHRATQDCYLSAFQKYIIIVSSIISHQMTICLSHSLRVLLVRLCDVGFVYPGENGFFADLSKSLWTKVEQFNFVEWIENVSVTSDICIGIGWRWIFFVFSSLTQVPTHETYEVFRKTFASHFSGGAIHPNIHELF